MHDVDRLRCDHDHATANQPQAETRPLWGILLAGATMVPEIVAGTLRGSMDHATVEVLRLREEGCPTLFAAERGI